MSQNIVIRKVIPNDNLALAIMIREVFDEHGAPTLGTVYSDPTTDNLYQLFQEPNSVLLVALVNKQPVGCCGVYPTQGLEQGYAELVKFYLAEQHRGVRIGRNLMEQCIESAKEMGYKYLYLESMPEFAKAVRIYENLGFTHLSHPLGNSGHSGCTIWMVKELW